MKSGLNWNFNFKKSAEFKIKIELSSSTITMNTYVKWMAQKSSDLGENLFKIRYENLV